MTTSSFPYFSIAQRARVPYALVLEYAEHAERLRHMSGSHFIPSNRSWEETVLSIGLRLEIRDAVKREQLRRMYSN